MELIVPDSPIAVASRDLAREVSSLPLYNHCERTYAFGAVLGDQEGFEFDPELLYVASILHDLGLTERFDGPDEFEVQGANAAHAFLTEQGWDPAKTNLVREAITFHTRPANEAHERREVPLLTIGAGVDCLGLGIEDVPSEWVHRIVEEWPREGLKAELVERFGDQARRKPESWIGMLVENLEWLERIQAAPFDE
jgi:hypothetical protein